MVMLSWVVKVFMILEIMTVILMVVEVLMMVGGNVTATTTMKKR